MPKFRLNKLVRDKLKDEYDHDEQKAIYRKLSVSDHKKELINKIVEEAHEIRVDGQKNDIMSEVADIQQALDDLIKLCGFTKDQIEYAKQAKFDRKGGFASGIFVETLELTDDDKWVNYYRKHPDIFPEK
jgi:predicted house-cleaning noncanonical NTP pyrophosphatase (MazG superfamily)